MKDTSEQLYVLGVVRPSSGGFTSQYGVRISTVVEKGQVDYVPVSISRRKVPGSSRKHSSSEKEKRKMSRIPVKSRRRFEISSLPVTPGKQPVVEDPTFASALASQPSPAVGEIARLLLSSKGRCFSWECFSCQFILCSISS